MTVTNTYLTLFRGKISYCSLLNHTQSNILITPIIQYFLPYTNLMEVCPFIPVNKFNFFCIFLSI